MMLPPTPPCDLDRLRAIIGRGLVAGLGTPKQTCIEGAVALACGLPLSDTPPCVAAPDRAYAIAVNDAPWSSPESRAEALLPLALAHVGTAGTDRRPWIARVVDGTIRRVLPLTLRAAANAPGMPPEHATALHAAAGRCATDGTQAAAFAARAAAWAAGDAAMAAILRESVAVALDAYRAEGRA